MKYIKSIGIVIMLVFLTSCMSTDQKNIHELIKSVNESDNMSLKFEDFTLTQGEELTYSYLTDGNSLISLYSSSTGDIIRCSVTGEKKNEEFLTTCKAIVSAFTGEPEEDSETAIRRAIAAGRSEFYRYVLLCVKSDAGISIIACHSGDEFLTNQSPTLKRHIDNDDISRPTIGKDDKTTLTIYQ